MKVLLVLAAGVAVMAASGFVCVRTAAAAPPPDAGVGPTRLEFHDALQLRLDHLAGTPDATTVRLRRGRVGLRLVGANWGQAAMEVAFDGWSLFPGAVAPPPLALLELHATFAVLPGRMWLTVGLFRPQLGRESLTSGFVVDSLDKALTQGPLREHLTGTTPGRAPGVNVGGLLPRKGWSARYDAGLVAYRAGADSGGGPRPPLLLARVAWTLGAPESETYALSLPQNDLRLQPGLTLALQASTELGGAARSVGMDALLRLSPWVLAAEVHQLNGEQAPLWLVHARTGVNLPGPWRTVVEPWAQIAHATGLPDAKAVSRLDAGVTWYLARHSLRVTLGTGGWPFQPREAAGSPGRQLGLSLQHRR